MLRPSHRFQHIQTYVFHIHITQSVSIWHPTMHWNIYCSWISFLRGPEDGLIKVETYRPHNVLVYCIENKVLCYWLTRFYLYGVRTFFSLCLTNSPNNDYPSHFLLKYRWLFSRYLNYMLPNIHLILPVTICIYDQLRYLEPIPVAARSKAWVCSRSLAGIVGLNPAGGMDVCCECGVLSGRDLCFELITRPEESYRLWCVKLSVIMNTRQCGGLGPLGLLGQGKKVLGHELSALTL